MRKVHINETEWEYVIGRKFISIRNPITQKRVSVDISVLKGVPWETIRYTRSVYCYDCQSFTCSEEEEEEKIDIRNAMIRPSDIKDYIKKNLL